MNEEIMGSINESSATRLITIATSSFNKVSSLEKSFDNLSELNKFFEGGCFDLSDDEIKDVELVILLLASANSVNGRRFDHARKFLNLCDFLSSSTGTTISRIVHYFSKALRDKIDGKNGASKTRSSSHPDETMVYLGPELITCSLKLPFIQVKQFAGLQAIIENISSSKRVHFIDLTIRSGAQCISLMQALSTRNEPEIELLKITAVGTTSKGKIEETGKRLSCFAATLNMPFCFNVVMVKDLKDIDLDMFELNDNDQAVVINSSLLLRHHMEPIIRMFKKLNPCIVVITEFETNHTSNVFLYRFSQALMFYTAIFDCLEDCMGRNDENRRVLEGLYLAEEIRNIVAAENDDRIFQDMKIESWRKIFTEFGMIETELSSSALFQADLVAQQFDPGKHCNCNRNGKSLVVNWKGIPIVSLSTWKLCD